MDDPLSLTFAMTLAAADKSTEPGKQFPKFGSLPLEIRTAIWENVLPASDDEPGAIFTQRHSYTWANDEGDVCASGELVPMRMTTTCAALLHVNKESRYLVLRWADSLGYQLCFRILCCDMDDICDLEEDSDGKLPILPVHGPIFVRPWSSDRDILDIMYSADFDGFPDEWAERYIEGEKVHDVQHLAISIADLEHYMDSKWFYQLLGAIPNLKSVSIDCEPLGEADGETFHGRRIHSTGVGDPWAALDGRKQHEDSTTSDEPWPECRWEVADPESEDLAKFEKFNFKDRLIEGFLDEGNWPQGGGAWEHYRDENGNGPNPWLRGIEGYEYLEPRLIPERKAKVLESLPPWIWDHDKDEFAFKLRVFQPIERRGYDDVGGGFTVKCSELYAL